MSFMMRVSLCVCVLGLVVAGARAARLTDNPATEPGKTYPESVGGITAAAGGDTEFSVHLEYH